MRLATPDFQRRRRRRHRLSRRRLTFYTFQSFWLVCLSVIFYTTYFTFLLWNFSFQTDPFDSGVGMTSHIPSLIVTKIHPKNKSSLMIQAVAFNLK